MKYHGNIIKSLVEYPSRSGFRSKQLFCRSDGSTYLSPIQPSVFLDRSSKKDVLLFIFQKWNLERNTGLLRHIAIDTCVSRESGGYKKLILVECDADDLAEADVTWFLLK